MIPFRYWIAAFVLMGAMLALNIPNLFGQSPTVDEYAHVPAGYTYWMKGDFRLYPKNPPFIKTICAAPVALMELENLSVKEWLTSSTSAWGPWRFADVFARLNKDKIKSVFAWARFMNLLLGAALGLVVFLWCSDIYGYRAGLVAMAFTVTSPTILAHAGVATVDAGFTMFFLLSLFLMMRFFETPGIGHGVAAGAAFGAAQLSKFSAVVLAPLVIIITAVLIIRGAVGWKHGRKPVKATFGKFVQGEIICMAVLLVAGLFFIHAGYLFRGSVTRLEGLPKASNLMKKATETPLARIPILLPHTYLKGLDLQLADAERGEFPNYINGKWRKKGVWYYFLEALSLKETLPGLLFIALGLILGIYHRIKWRKESTGKRLVPFWPFVHLPLLVFLAVISLAGNLQLGVRYAMPVIPLAFIAAAGGIFYKPSEPKLQIEKKEGSTLGVVKESNFDKRAWKGYVVPAILAALFAWQCVEIAAAAPHYLSYFNEVAGGAGGGPRYLLDSNVDWGQDLPALSKELERMEVEEVGLLYFGHAHPSWYDIKWRLPRRGDRYYAVSVNFLHGYPYALTYLRPWKKRPPMITDPDYRRLLRLAKELYEREPVARAGGSIYIYDMGKLTEPEEGHDLP